MKYLQLTLLALAAYGVTSAVEAIQTVRPVNGSGQAIGSVSQATGTVVEFYARYESDFGGAESGLGLKVEYDSSKLGDLAVDQVLAKCMIAAPQTQTGLALTGGNNARVVMGWIDTSLRANGAVGWPGLADPASPSGCLNPGGISTVTAAAPIPTTLFRVRATLSPGFTAGSTTVRFTSEGNYSYAGPSPGFSDQTINIASTGACNLATNNLDCDKDGIPNGVEVVEGRNPAAKDNLIFAGQNTNSNRWFAMQQYRDFLGREGDAGGITYWANALAASSATRTQTIENFFNSTEFQNSVAPAVRLYFAYFNRIPDYDGLQFWVNEFKSGNRTLENISQQFATLPEFQQKYGNLTNQAFVNQLYTNVLLRAADPVGAAYWTQQINSGALNRGQVMLQFSESNENILKEVRDVYVTMMYVGMLRRSPDATGYGFWVDYLGTSGNTGRTLIQLFLDSPEYFLRFQP